MSKWKIIVLAFFSLIILLYALLWLFSIKKYPVEYGISFSRFHADYLGLDWKETYLKMLDELKPKYIRLNANWDDMEKNPGEFDTKELDWQMAEAGKRGVKVVLVVGQKVPRWPECHIPDWANQLTDKKYQIAVKGYIKFVVEKYKKHSALEIWQVENEPFIDFVFGECKKFDKSLITKEIALVKSLDSEHKVLVTDSGEMSTWRQASSAGDIFGTTIYRVVMTPNGWYWHYDWLPAGFYKLKALLWGKSGDNFIVAELQAEPWFGTGLYQVDVPIKEQEKSLSIAQLKKNLDYTERIGVSRTYLWGVEWWYWMKTAKNDSRYWDLIKERM